MPAFGRLPAKDRRDALYPMRLALPPTPTPKLITSKMWTAARRDPLDQGQQPACVGFAWRHWLDVAPVMSATIGPDGLTLYQEARARDEWPGEDYEGTSVRGGAKAMQDRAHLAAYVWASSVADVRDWILLHGPVVLGTDWYDGMMEPGIKTGIIRAEGSVVGGHAYLAIGYSSSRKAFRILNSWGPAWGQHGRAWLPETDMAKLLVNQGEACAATETALVRVP